MAIEKQQSTGSTSARQAWQAWQAWQEEEQGREKWLDHTEFDQEWDSLRVWMQGELRRAVTGSFMHPTFQEPTGTTLSEVLLPALRAIEEVFTERLQGWDAALRSLPLLEKEYREHREYEAWSARYKEEKAAKAAALQAAAEAEAAAETEARVVPLRVVKSNSHRHRRRNAHKPGQP